MDRTSVFTILVLVLLISSTMPTLTTSNYFPHLVNRPEELLVGLFCFTFNADRSTEYSLI
jgi:hypothetical protein